MLAEYDENGTLTTNYTRADELISQERNGAKSYYLYDGSDSVRMLANEDGEITDTYTFDAFGNLTASTGSTKNDFLYRGEQYDSFTGLYYLRARYMNPATGTFITMDEYAGSVFEPVSLHKYLYANANPVMYSDPSGYFTLSEAVNSMAIQAQLSAVICASLGGILNSLLVRLRGGTEEEIQQAFLDGMASGFIFGGIFGALGGLAAYYWQAQLILAACEAICGYYAFRDAAIDFTEGHYEASFISFLIGLGCTFSSTNNVIGAINAINGRTLPRINNNPKGTDNKNYIGPDFDPKGPKYQEGIDPRSLTPQKDLSTLDPQRQANAVKYGREQAITVDRHGVIQDGHHRVNDAINAIKNNRSVDVFIE